MKKLLAAGVLSCFFILTAVGCTAANKKPLNQDQNNQQQNQDAVENQGQPNGMGTR